MSDVKVMRSSGYCSPPSCSISRDATWSPVSLFRSACCTGTQGAAYGTHGKEQQSSCCLAARVFRPEASVYLEFGEQLGQGWVLDGVFGSDFTQEEIPEAVEPILTHDVLRLLACFRSRWLFIFRTTVDLPPRHRNPEMRGAGYKEKHDGA